MGYHAHLTDQSRDGGIDVYAKRISEAGTENIAIQCKHYPQGVVGVEHARALYGCIQAESSITKGVLATSGGFSKGCKDFVSQKRIDLFDGTHLCGLAEKFGLSISKS